MSSLLNIKAKVKTITKPGKRATQVPVVGLIYCRPSLMNIAVNPQQEAARTANRTPNINQSFTIQIQLIYRINKYYCSEVVFYFALTDNVLFLTDIAMKVSLLRTPSMLPTVLSIKECNSSGVYVATHTNMSNAPVVIETFTV